jgi:hypothetical protein
VFAHVDNVHEFLEAVRLCLSDDGVFLIEVPYLGAFLDHREFDTIYHEHLSYISLGAMEHLCRQHALELVDVEEISLHGGSIILHMRRSGIGAQPSERLRQLMARERASRVSDPQRLKQFASDVREWRTRFEELVAELRGGGASLIGYGAAAKANTLLNYCPSVANSLSCILDRSAHKHGRYTPGTHIRVEPVDHWRNGKTASHMIVLAWNFKDEIMAQMKAFADAGGRFVIPIPKPHVV